MKNLTLVFSFLLIFLIGCNNNEINQINTTSIDNSSNSNTQRLSAQNSFTSNLSQEEELSTFSTSIRLNEPDRENNINLGCKELNGYIVKAGETFSFCNTLGPATPDKGYKKAESFDSDGNIIMEYGGGKCQISSTLYNAVLAVPTLTVIERYPHSNKVDYVEEGKDATVCYGSVDFKFKNDNNFDIKIIATSENNTLTISLFKI